MIVKGEFLKNLFTIHSIYIINHQLEIVGDASSINPEKIYTVVGYDLTQTNTQIQGIKLCNIMVEEAFTIESLGEVYQDSIVVDTDTLIGTNKCENVQKDVPISVDSSTEVQSIDDEDIKEEVSEDTTNELL